MMCSAGLCRGPGAADAPCAHPLHGAGHQLRIASASGYSIRSAGSARRCSRAVPGAAGEGLTGCYHLSPPQQDQAGRPQVRPAPL